MLEKVFGKPKRSAALPREAVHVPEVIIVVDVVNIKWKAYDEVYGKFEIVGSAVLVAKDTVEVFVLFTGAASKASVPRTPYLEHNTNRTLDLHLPDDFVFIFSDLDAGSLALIAQPIDRIFWRGETYT